MLNITPGFGPRGRLPGIKFHTYIQKLLQWPLEMWYMGAYPRHYSISHGHICIQYVATIDMHRALEKPN